MIYFDLKFCEDVFKRQFLEVKERNENEKCFLAPVLYSDHHESEYCFDWCRSNAVSELMMRGKSLQYSFYNASISSNADEFGIS